MFDSHFFFGVFFGVVACVIIGFAGMVASVIASRCGFLERYFEQQAEKKVNAKYLCPDCAKEEAAENKKSGGGNKFPNPIVGGAFDAQA